MMYGTKSKGPILSEYWKLIMHMTFSIFIVVQCFQRVIKILSVTFLVATKLKKPCECPVHYQWNRPYIPYQKGLNLINIKNITTNEIYFVVTDNESKTCDLV